MTKTRIPEGFREDSLGRLVPESTIKEMDLKRDALVYGLAAEAETLSQTLAAYKAETMERIEAFAAESAARFGAKVGGQKGNMTLLSFDGRFKVQVANQPKINFNESLQTAKALIDKCIRAWSDGADPKILALVNDAFQVDQEGRVSVGRILGLRRLDIQDKSWRKAMDAITDSIQITGSKSYVRVYRRDDETGEYLPISLDVAGV